MTEPQIGTGLSDIKVELSSSPAPVEQQSPETLVAPKSGRSLEMVTTEPKTVLESPEPADTALPEPIKAAEPSANDKANEAARQAIGDRLRADEAERKLKELQPKSTVPDKKPDINDQSTWGEKYKGAPNDLETFLQARDEWAEAQGEKRANERFEQEKALAQQRAVQAAVLQKIQESRVKHNDFDAVLGAIAPIVDRTPILTDFLAKNPMGTEVMYELGKNPAILEQIMRGDVWTAGEQLLNIAARLKKPTAPQITNAPEPIKPVGSRETVKPSLLQLAEKDTAGYIATMNKRELARRRAN